MSKMGVCVDRSPPYTGAQIFEVPGLAQVILSTAYFTGTTSKLGGARPD